MARQKGVYELKLQLPSMNPAPHVRLYQVDLLVDGIPTIGCFKAAIKSVEGLSSYKIRENQDTDIDLANKRCDRACRTGQLRRLN